MTKDLTLIVRATNPKTNHAVVVVRRMPLVTSDDLFVSKMMDKVVGDSLESAAQEAENKLWIQGSGRKGSGPLHTLD